MRIKVHYKLIDKHGYTFKIDNEIIFADNFNDAKKNVKSMLMKTYVFEKMMAFAEECEMPINNDNDIMDFLHGIWKK